MADTTHPQEAAWRDAQDNEARNVRHNLVNQSPWLTPYLGLRARLSQVWLNRWTILLFLVLVRVLFAIADIEDKVNDAHGEALASCKALENVGSTLASAPHYMAGGVNELTATGVEKAIDGLMSMLNMMVTGVEEIVIFAINVYTQTYLCLITLAISGALHAALAVIEDVTHFINDTIGAIGKDLHTAIDGFDGALNSAITGFDKLLKIHIPTLNVGDSLDKLDHLELPPGIDQGLQKLNSSIPNFAQVNNLTQEALRFPFEEVKQLISNHTGHYNFNRSLFPVPQKQKLTFCSRDNSIDHFFNGLIDVEVTARKVAIAVLVILAIGVCIPMTWWEIQRWRRMQDKARYLDDNAYDSMDAVYVISRPWSSMLGIEASKRVTSDYKRQTLIRWVVAYCTSTPALFVLSLGIAGLFSGLCHYLCLKVLTKEVPQLTQEISHFADEIMDTVQNVSTTWTNQTNGVIVDMNTKINHDVFGWVNTSTTALNNTLNTATDEMVHALQVVFNGTILQDPVMEVYNCIIGLKIAGIEKGLTWVQNHAHIDFPLLPNDTFSLSHLSQKAGSDPDTDKAASFLDDPDSEGEAAIKNAVAKLVAKIEKHILQELIISAVVVGIWLVVLLLGLGRMAWLMFKPDKTRGTGGGMNGVAFPWRPRGGPSNGGSLKSKLGSLKDRFAWKGSHNHSLGPASPIEVKDGGFVNVSEKAVPPDPPREGNPFDTPKLPDHAHMQQEPTLPNVDSTDNGASRWQGQDYTLAPKPMPLFSNGPREGAVPTGAVGAVTGHPRASWRPEVVGREDSGSSGGSGGNGEARQKGRMESIWMFGGRR